MDNNFEEIYEKIVNELNKEDIQKSKDIKLDSKTIIVMIIILILTILTGSIFIFLIGLLMIFIILILKQKKKKNQFFKQNVIKKMVEYYNSKFTYNPTTGINSAEYKQVWNEYYDRYYTEDDINGILTNNCKFEMSDVTTQEVSKDSEGRETVNTIFSGIFAKIELPANFIDELYIGKNSKIAKNKEQIKMDSSEFEKHFKVYASNKVIAFQLLTLDIMQMLIEYEQNSKIDFEICIKANNLYIRYWTGNVFELGFTQDVTNHDIIQKYYNILDFTIKFSEKLSNIIKEIE